MLSFQTILPRTCSESVSARYALLPRRRSRRGSATAFGIVMIGVMAVLLGLTIDLGYIHNSQAELTRTSDSAALAGAWALFDGRVAERSEADLVREVTQSADQFSQQNKVGNAAPRLSLTGNDVKLGFYDVSTNTFIAESPLELNAVRVSVRREENTNGEVPLFFGMFSGRQSQSMASTSTAALVNSIEGFYLPDEEGSSIEMLPFALDIDTWTAVENGQAGDSLSWVNGQVVRHSNGRHECNLYPQGTGSPGNRGTVDIGSANNSTRDISRQIVHGISRNDLLTLGGPLEFNEQDELYLNGDTGISAGVKDELQSIVGEKRVIPIFREVNGNGNNATYTIVKFAGVRILEVKLTGRMNQKRVIIEPAPVIARHSKIRKTGTRMSSHVYTPVMLVE